MTDGGLPQQIPSSPRSGPVPREVNIASVLLLALGGILAFNAALALIYREDIVGSAEREMVAYVSSEQLTTVIAVATGILLTLSALLILAGLHVRRGRQWARVLAFVAAGLVIVFAGTGALAGGGFLAVLLLGAAVGAVAFLMQGAVAPYFERSGGYPGPP
ncbi:MAG: hypothetical protein H0T66_14795 [Geodermatophilaceae bacterium]|nr:hypothetical protein [Geodermatophilaceae bacterium]